MIAPQKESIFSRSCRLSLLSWRRARVFARSCSLLSKYLPISWKQRKEQSHAQCHVTYLIRIFDKISEHVKVAKSVDIAVPELAVTMIPVHLEETLIPTYDKILWDFKTVIDVVLEKIKNFSIFLFKK